MQGKEQQNFIVNIKSAITEATLMKHLDPIKPFYLDCNASNVGLSAPLHQRDEPNNEQSVACASRTLRLNEREWHFTELEALAVVYAFEDFFKPILKGQAHW